MTAKKDQEGPVICHFCGKEAKEWDELAGKPACFDCIIAAEESLGLSREELYGHERSMDCPYCGTPMEHGYVNLHGSLISSFMTGLSWLQCYFQPMRRREDTLVLGKHQKRAALLCPECHAVHIRGTVRE